VINALQLDADYDDLGDPCDPAPNTPNGSRYVRKCDKDVFIGVAGSDTAVCAELTSPAVPPTPAPSVGGIAEPPDLAARPAPSGGAPSTPATAYAVGIVAIAALLALGSGLTWRARRRA
jgi:hypothetical protein